MEKDCLDDAIKHLHRANDLAREQKLNFGDDIAFQLRLARKKRWNVQEVGMKGSEWNDIGISHNHSGGPRHSESGYHFPLVRPDWVAH